MNIKKTIYWIIYFIAIGILFITPTFQLNPEWMYEINNVFNNSINIIPFKTIIYYISSLMDNSINVNIAIGFFIRNLIVGLPLGLLIPATIKNVNIKNFILITILVSLGIEVLSFMLRIGVIDIDAILLRLIAATIIFYTVKNIPKLNKFINNIG